MLEELESESELLELVADNLEDAPATSLLSVKSDKIKIISETDFKFISFQNVTDLEKVGR